MRLLFVLPEYPPDYGGGIATYYGALLPALVRRGHEVHVLVGSAVTHGTTPYIQEGVQVTGLETGRTERLMPSFSRYAAIGEVQRFLASARAMWEQADGGAGFDAVEVVDWGMLFAPWISEASAPTLVQVHGSSGQITMYDAFPGHELADQTLRLIEPAVMRGARRIQAYSQANGAFWEAQTGREVGVSPPPIPAQERVRGAATAEGFVAARIQEWKGPQILAEALRHLGTDAPTVEWAGRTVAHPRTGEPYDAVLAREYPDVWGSRIRPLGRVDPPTVSAKQARAAFVVVPSLWDVYNLTVAEAMMQGAVVICADGAGGVDLVEDGRNAFAFAAGDARALADAIRRARGLAPSERVALGEAARETALRQTDPARVAEAAEERYHTLSSAPAMPLAPWAREAVQPGRTSTLSSFLGRLPLSALLKHAARRLRDKTPLRARA